jgi:hypothetical protein
VISADSKPAPLRFRTASRKLWLETLPPHLRGQVRVYVRSVKPIWCVEAAVEASLQDSIEERMKMPMTAHEQGVVVEGKIADSELPSTVFYLVGHSARLSSPEAWGVKQGGCAVGAAERAAARGLDGGVSLVASQSVQRRWQGVEAALVTGIIGLVAGQFPFAADDEVGLGVPDGVVAAQCGVGSPQDDGHTREVRSDPLDGLYGTRIPVGHARSDQGHVRARLRA